MHLGKGAKWCQYSIKTFQIVRATCTIGYASVISYKTVARLKPSGGAFEEFLA